MKKNNIFCFILSRIRNFFIIFFLISFVITCTFLVFFASVTLAEEDVRTFAPIVFTNVIVLSVLFFIADEIRRKISIDRPTKAIRKALKQLTEGDFSARISAAYFGPEEYRFAEIAENINALAQELGGIESLRTDFLANVSHEIKTPLAVIRNYADMLSLAGIDEKDRVEYAKVISSASRRLADLVTNVLKLTKLENQQIFPQNDPFDLGEQLCECILQFESQWEAKELVIQTEIQDNVQIRSDAQLLSLVWNNLISNAIKFTPTGGTVRVEMRTEDENIIVSVADTGCGMTQEVGSHIFEKFYQGDTSHATQGNGLGLALVKRVVDILQAEITVESICGKGSIFVVQLRRS